MAMVGARAVVVDGYIHAADRGTPPAFLDAVPAAAGTIVSSPAWFAHFAVTTQRLLSALTFKSIIAPAAHCGLPALLVAPPSVYAWVVPLPLPIIDQLSLLTRRL